MDRLSYLDEGDVDRLVSFIFQRQKENSCFAAAPSLPATVADTCYALTMVRQLDSLSPKRRLFSRINREKIHAFVAAHVPVRTSLPLRVRFFLWSISRLVAGEAADYEDPCDDLEPSILTFENYYYLGRLAGELRQGFRVEPLRLADCTCRDLYFFLLSFPEAAAARARELGGWLQNCWNYDGGFGFFPGTTSYIEYCDYSLSALSLLNMRPLHCRQAQQYILACRTGAGGFSRSTKAAPFLDASCHALHALECLWKWKQQG